MIVILKVSNYSFLFFFADINFCENNLCRNSGTCIQRKDGYDCICQTDFTGKYCELSIRKCDQQPCQNGGLCIDLPNDFNCSCINKWKGKTCTSSEFLKCPLYYFYVVLHFQYWRIIIFVSNIKLRL